MSSLVSDLRHSLRVLTSNPGFTTVAVAALALGMGANTAIFSVVNAVLLAPLPYPQPDRIMRIQRSFQGQTGGGGSVSIPKFMAWKKANQTFQAMALYDFSGPGLNLGSGDHPQQMKGIHVSAEYFQVFGVSPSMGRTFLPAGRSAQRRESGGVKRRSVANAALEATRRWSASRSCWEAIPTRWSEFFPLPSIPILPPTFSSPCRPIRTAPIKATICWPPAA